MISMSTNPELQIKKYLLSFILMELGGWGKHFGGWGCCLLFAMIVFVGGGLWDYRAEDRVLHVSDDNFDRFSARLHSTFGRASDSRFRGPGFDTWSSHYFRFSFL